MISPLSISILIISLIIFFTDPYFSNRVLNRDTIEINEGQHNSEAEAPSESDEEEEEGKEDIQ